MKIIDAFWEKRNLGVSTTEVTIEKDDSIEEIVSNLKKIDSEYVVVKCHTADVDLNFELAKLGFTFVETLINVTHNLKNVQLDMIQQRIADSVSYQEMDAVDLEQLFSELNKGLFYTDRVYLDSHFPKESAANRYKLWLQDELNRGSQIYKLTYKDKSIGFFIFKDLGDGVAYPFLAGIYPEFQKFSFGSMFIYKPIEEAVKRKFKMISTYVSSNNFNAVNSHVKMGFNIRNMQYVFVKHNQKMQKNV